jgi:thioesterase domain-containing protein/acyl carrier protein
VDTDALVELGETLGYRVEPSWDRSDASGRLDVLFHRGQDRAAVWPAQPRPARLPWDRYANRPRLKTAAAALIPAVRTHLRERLPDFLMPRALVLLDTLPRSADGGLDLAALPRPARHRLAGDSLSAGPRTPVERELAALWQRLLGIESVGPEDNFFELGGHSLLAIKLFAEIERTFGRKLPLSTLYQAPSLGLLAGAIAGASPDRPASALAVLQPRGSRPPLFLVHGPQGDVLEYRYLVARLGDDQPVFGLEARDEGEPAPRTIEQLAAGYVEQLRRAQPTGPYQLCGYCWAGTLTFEIARQLRAAGGEVALVALIDAACPGYRGPRRPARAAGRRRSLRTRILQGLERLPELEVTAVLRFLRAGMVRVATEVAGVPAFRWSVRLGRPLLPAFRGRRQALLYAARAYRPTSYPGRLTLLRAWLGATDAEPDALWGWDRVAAEGVDLHRVPGTHLELMTEPRVESVAAALRACLAGGHAEPEREEKAEECGSRPG